MTDEKPAPQSWYLRVMGEREFDSTSEAATLYLQDFLRRVRVDLNPQRVRLVTELGLGVGQETQALLALFPKATVHVIDFHDHLHRKVKGNPRVVFHQGLFVEVLRLGGVPPSDVVLMNNINRLHGFTGENIHLLTRLVGGGRLLALGDNYGIEAEPWFRGEFKLIGRDNDDPAGAAVYKAKG